jgi:hypothetical protein
MINVKVVQIPGQTREVNLNPGQTVGDAIRLAEISVGTGSLIKVNGANASTSTVLNENTTVLITAKITGNR